VPLIAVGLLVGGIAYYLLLQHSIDERVDHGLPVEARITDVQRFNIGRLGGGVQRLTVSYLVNGQTRESHLMAMLAGESHVEGESITVYVLGKDHGSVATEDGYVSEGWFSQLPIAMIAVGGILGLNSIVSFLRRRKRDSRSR
jgi:hypothetical protein